MIEIVMADRSMIRHVLANLRADDLDEMTAACVDMDTLPEIIVRKGVFALCAMDFVDGPVAIWGMLQRRPGVGAGFAFGTDGWGQALLPMLRNIREFVIPLLHDFDYHRVEAAALARRDDVARFMRMIGAKPEGTLRGYGCGGEDFISYRWLADEHGRERSAHEAQYQQFAH